MKNKIVILDEVLSQRECKTLIDNFKPEDKWNTNYPMSIRDGYAMDIARKIEARVNKYFDNLVQIDWCQVVWWPVASYQDLHLDTASDETILTSITYLNTDFFGGETYIENDMQMVPKVGRTVCFDGMHYRHGVRHVVNGDRYTLPIWYKIKT